MTKPFDVSVEVEMVYASDKSGSPLIGFIGSLGSAISFDKFFLYIVFVATSSPRHPGLVPRELSTLQQIISKQ